MDPIRKASSERREVSTDSGQKANVLGSRMSTGRVVRFRPLVLRFRVPVLGAGQPGSDECHRQSESKIIRVMFITLSLLRVLPLCGTLSTYNYTGCSRLHWQRAHLRSLGLGIPSRLSSCRLTECRLSQATPASKAHVRTHHYCEGDLAERVHMRGRATCSVDCTATCRVKRSTRARWRRGLFVLALHVLTSSSFRL